MEISPEFVQRYNRPGPRYTSYPPAPHFSDQFQLSDWISQIEHSNRDSEPLSFYFHIPFCPKRCLYCGCNTEIGAASPMIQQYQTAILTELDRVLPYLDRNRMAIQCHFGGGTPNAVPLSHLRTILEKIRSRFSFSPQAEIALECDPNMLTEWRLEQYRKMGFNRISFGLQDFNLEVLKAVGRGFPKIHPMDLIRRSKELGFSGINLDLIYGLPRQTPESFRHTLRQAVEAEPERIAVFSYAHVPWLKPHQRQMEKYGFPSPEDKIQMSADTHNYLCQKGYTAIGMDHFAVESDLLTKALREKQLHRNFQGYCTKETTAQVYAFGSSGISQLHSGYGQNLRDADDYIRRVTEGKWPIEKIYRMTQEDIFRKEILYGLMCRGELDLESLSEKQSIPLSFLQDKLAGDLERIEPFVQEGLLEHKGYKWTVTDLGWLVVRCIAMEFDPLLEKRENLYSRTV